MKAGESAVVVGACGGIGKNLIAKLLKQGLQVAALDFDEEGLKALKADSAAQGYNLFCQFVDVTVPTSIQKAADAVVKEFDLIKYWINGAGIARNDEFEKISSDDFRAVFAVNFEGVVHATRVALEIMDAQSDGQILNIASVAGHVAAPYMSPYVASKFAVVGFTRSLQVEYAFKDSPILIQLASPGFVHTGMIRLGEKLGFPEWLKFMLANPNDVATDIVKCLRKKTPEAVPTWNGKLMVTMHKWFPRTTRLSSKILLTKRPTDILLNRYHLNE